MDTNSTSSTKSSPEDSSPSPPSPPPADDQPPPSSPPPADDQPPPSSPPPSSSSPPPSSPPPSPDPPENTPPPPLPSPPPSTSSPPPPSPTPTVYSPPPPEEDAEPPPEPPIPSPSFDTPLPSPPPSPPPPPPTQTQDSPPSPALTPPPNSTPSDSQPPPPPPTTSLPLPAPPPPPPDTFLLQPTFQGSPPPPVLQSPILPPRSLTPPTNKTPITQSNLTPSLNSTDKRGLSTVEALAIGVVVGSLLICIIGTTTWWWLRKRRRYVSGPKLSYTMPTSSHGFSPKAESMFLKVATVGYEPCPSPSTLNQSKSAFTYEELAEATNGFSEQNVLGKGGFGSVYKGCLPDGRYVAVKELNLGGGQGEREFRAEVDIISRVHHRHLVSLVGYCISEQRRLLIYDYVPNDTLHFHLHGEGRPVLAWEARVKIAIGAARGIAYLHEDCTLIGHPRIIHRDIKSSNILLGENFEAQVADFGLAKLCPDTHTHVSTRVMGTFGYMAPEYASSGKLTEKSDVFSYGVVLLELITGRKPVDTSKPVGEDSLVEWARPLLHSALQTEEYEAIVDPRLKKNYVDSELCQMIEAAAACVRHSALKRPRMTLIVRAFDGLSKADLSNGMRVGESEMFNPVQHSAEVRLLKLMAFGSQQYSTDFYSQYTRDSEKGDSEESYYIPR